MKYLLLLPLLALVGCNESDRLALQVTYGNVIPAEDTAAAARFITETVAASASSADKEPADRIKEATASAFKLYAKPTFGAVIYLNMNPVFVPYEKCDAHIKALCDEWAQGHKVERQP